MDQLVSKSILEKHFIKEDIKHLEEWLEKAKELANSISTKSQESGVKSIFTISTTTKVSNKHYPYLTPIRKIIHGFIGGSVVFSQTQAYILSKHIDGIVDLILVDAEKKIGITLGVDKNALEHFALEFPHENVQSRVHVEMGNLSASCAMVIEKSQFHEYKPNDMTVEAVWHFLSYHFKILSGKKIAIIGGGNIGFKLALKLVESGSNIELVRRDMGRGTLMTDVIDIAKPTSTIAIAHYNPDPLQASLFSDAIIGCTNGAPVITWKMIQSMKPDGIVIDVGKGSVFKDAVQQSIKHNIPIFRSDISSAIDGVISTIQRNKQIIEKEIGRREIKKNIFIVSGGQLGEDGDLVVDNYVQPRQIFGIANGMGDLKQNLSKKDKENIKKMKGFIIE